ncbi:hypothetical protein BDW42DRAFT_199946 [Aspergillus taichungensis]|uniref:Uncharacterized protein n=1 Tax=Aspergillus taichungensis TaxID=482145 RepID=A0A2J5I2A7_9EURO|nr:hypothetical protein BDW42DRAFT_199946 [Aspergillus taichungensis]
MPSSLSAKLCVKNPNGDRPAAARHRYGYQKVLSRFYEPLLLLRALGQTRGDHTTISLDLGPEEARRRRFLQNLAYIGDVDKSSISCTAIGLEDAETRYKFWIASNQVNGRSLDFFKTVFGHLECIHGHSPGRPEQDRNALVMLCVGFAAKRIREEKKTLVRKINECYPTPGAPKTKEDQDLRDWLYSVVEQDDNLNLCRYAYKHRHSTFLDLLIRKAHEGKDLIDPIGKRSPFASVRHCLGRLAEHIRAPLRLIEDAGHLGQLLDCYEVCAIDPISPVSRQFPDAQTTLRGILNRMLKKDDPERPQIEDALHLINIRSHTFEQFRKLYEYCTPQVHAEVQVLEHFYRNGLRFVGNDRYVACSKPACLCCEMYFKHHPARMVVPASHNKVWTNWSPPLVEPFVKSDPESKQQLEILNKMTADIRSRAIAQILKQSPASHWHPDSLTNITDPHLLSSDFSGFSIDGSSDDSAATALDLSGTETPTPPIQGDELTEGSDLKTGGVSICA